MLNIKNPSSELPPIWVFSVPTRMAIKSLKDILEIISPSEEQGTTGICLLQNTLPLEPEAPTFLSLPGGGLLSCQSSKKRALNQISETAWYFYSMGVGNKSKLNLKIKLEIRTIPLTSSNTGKVIVWLQSRFPTTRNSPI